MLFYFGGLDDEDVEARELLDGSPRVALGIEPEFTACVFLEKSRKRIKELETLQTEFSLRRIRIEHGDCNAYLREKLVRNADWKRWRAVVFLDPFGMQVPWSTLQALGATGGIEIILNLPIGMAIQRLLKRTGKFTDEERAKLDVYFGDAAWYPLLYEEGTDLFGERRVAKQETAERRLLSGAGPPETSIRRGVGNIPRNEHQGRPPLLRSLGRPEPNRAQDHVSSV